MSLIWIAITLPVLCLVLVIIRAIYGLASDCVQNQRAIRIDRMTAEQGHAQLSDRLNQTYVDLAQSRRRADWRELVIVKVVQESEDVKSFYLVDESLEPLPAAMPGQHILVQSGKQSDSHRVCRCYSLSDDNTAGHWRISVKKSSEKPASVSRWLHEEKVAGDTLNAKGPSGAFHFETVTGRNAVLVSAGIGVTPMLPMLMEAIRRGSASIHFFTQCRDLAHLPFADSLLGIARQHRKVNLHVWVSRWPKGVRRPDNEIFVEGKFQASDLLLHSGSTSSSDYYVCGPELWQDQIKSGLIEAGVPSASIRYELFQQSEKPAVRNDFANHRVHFKQTGAEAKFESSYSSLLVCAGKNSVALESGCRTGACGSCAIKLLSGKVRYTRVPQFEIQASEILPCVCVPESDLEVDA